MLYENGVRGLYKRIKPVFGGKRFDTRLTRLFRERRKPQCLKRSSKKLFRVYKADAR